MRRLLLPEAAPYGIEVWLLELNLQAPLSDSDLNLVSEDEYTHALRFRRHEDRVRSITTRAALRKLVAAQTGSSPQSLCFITNCYGKPRLRDEPEIEFNVSHSGRFALIALSAIGEVGVDIEYRNHSIDAKSLDAYIFSPLERRTGLSAAGCFIEHWVAKEAVLKALGLGVSEHLQTVSILPFEGEGYYVTHDKPEWGELSAWRIEAPEGYAAALGYAPPGRGVPGIRSRPAGKNAYPVHTSAEAVSSPPTAV